MPNKDRLLLLLKTLQENSDDETWLTTAQLRAALEAEGHECSIRTLRRDVKAIQACGWDIGVRETNGLSTKYAFLDREWSRPELQILVDAVCAARFIPQKRSEDLIKKLSAMAGPSHTGELKPEILVSEHVKAKNKNMIYSVQAIRQAIDRDKKIRFKYLQYDTEKKQVPKREEQDGKEKEKEYVVSPYATVWNDDRYYLVGYSDRRRKVAVFRIDRMEVPKIMPNRRVPPPEDFDIRDYTDKVFRMYGGEEENVTLKCSLEILDQVIDRFGTGITLKKVTKKSFTVTVPVSLSTTFYAWVFQYVGKMSIRAPEHVREAYAGFLQEAIDDVLGE